MVLVAVVLVEVVRRSGTGEESWTSESLSKMTRAAVVSRKLALGGPLKVFPVSANERGPRGERLGAAELLRHLLSASQGRSLICILGHPLVRWRFIYGTGTGIALANSWDGGIVAGRARRRRSAHERDGRVAEASIRHEKTISCAS